MRSALYGLLDNNIKHVTTVLEDCMDAFMQSKSFKDKMGPRAGQSQTMSGSEVFAPILDMLFEYVCFSLVDTKAEC